MVVFPAIDQAIFRVMVPATARVMVSVTAWVQVWVWVEVCVDVGGHGDDPSDGGGA